MPTQTQDARDQLIEDFKKVINDAEDLIKATANQTGDKVGAVRQRAEENLKEARRKLNEMEDSVVARTKTAVKATDQLVHDRPWQSVAVASAVGVVLGMLIGRR